MWLGAVLSRPNMGLSVDASRSNMWLGAVVSKPNVGLGMDAYRSNMELVAIESRPNMRLGVDASISNLALDAVASKTDVGWAWTCLGPTWRWTRSLPDPTWGSGSGSRQGKGKPTLAPCDAWLNLAQGQVSSSARCPHMGVQAWLTPRQPHQNLK
jgi:hypothetical protein